jgi:hypothetical protein
MPATLRLDGAVRERVLCRRCAQGVERTRAEWVASSSPAGRPVGYLLCPPCADEVRRGLLRLLAMPNPRPTPYEEEHGESPTLLARAGWFVVRVGGYGLLMLAVFAFVGLILTH